MVYVGEVSLVFCLFSALLVVRVAGNDGQVIGGVHACCCALRVSPCADLRGSRVSGEGCCYLNAEEYMSLSILSTVYDVVYDLWLYCTTVPKHKHECSHRTYSTYQTLYSTR